MAASQEMPRGRFDPLRLDDGSYAGVTARGLGDLRGHDPVGRPLEQGRSRKELELHPAGTGVFVLVGLEPDVPEQAGEQAAMDGFIGCRLRVAGEAQLLALR